MKKTPVQLLSDLDLKEALLSIENPTSHQIGYQTIEKLIETNPNLEFSGYSTTRLTTVMELYKEASVRWLKLI